MYIEYRNIKVKGLCENPSASVKFRHIAEPIRKCIDFLFVSETLGSANQTKPSMKIKKMQPSKPKFVDCGEVRIDQKYRLILKGNAEEPHKITIITIQFIDDHTF